MRLLESIQAFNIDQRCMTLLESILYLKQALSLGQSVALHGPEVDVGLPTGDNQIGLHRVEGGSQY